MGIYLATGVGAACLVSYGRGAGVVRGENEQGETPERQWVVREGGEGWGVTCPQELGQPVQWILTGSGTSSCSSSFSIMALALFLVSMMATPQN